MRDPETHEPAEPSPDRDGAASPSEARVARPDAAGASGGSGAGPAGGGARGWLLRVAGLLLAGVVLAALLSRGLLVGPVFDDLELRLPPDVHTLVVGASHGACALDPRAFDALPGDDESPPASGRAVSVARHGELMVSTHAKLQALLAANPGVRRVLLAFAPIHVAAWQDEHLLGGNAHSRNQLMEYYPLYDERTRAELPALQGDVLLARLKYDLDVPFDVTDDLALYARHATGALRPWHHRFWGGHTPLDGSHLEPELLERVVERYFRVDGGPAGVSPRAVRSVERIAELTRAAGVQLVLLDTPVHASFRAVVPGHLRAEHERVLAELRRRDPALVVLRDADLELPDGSYLDPDHLNAAGARTYSARVAAALAQRPPEDRR